MKLSTRARYGLKAMFDLAMNESKGPIPIREIATRQDISESYLEQLFASMRKAGLIKSVRGSHGGYLLGAESKDIFIGDILRALEGSIAPTDCVDQDKLNICSDSDACLTKMVWEKMRDSINDVVDSTTLYDVMFEQGLIDDKALKPSHN